MASKHEIAGAILDVLKRANEPLTATDLAIVVAVQLNDGTNLADILKATIAFLRECDEVPIGQKR